MSFFCDNEYKGINGKSESLQVGDYEDCTFADCDFSDCDFSDFRFDECRFINCNLSMIKLINTSFRDAVFQNCKMMGLRFEDCNSFGLSFSFSDCMLDHSTFYAKTIKSTKFINCHMHEIDFSETDLTSSLFQNSDLLNAAFENSNLEKADFTSAYNYSLDPDRNTLKKTRFSKDGLHGLLNRFDIIID
jgi:uncharacterized protein YjbI with pentapeptide repeats